mmetsp:Transcript_17652/g.43133  ORF Transcript_17652/g.43133 Transcript_17652/m.43133 type:complete len:290 (-) Transcript_17652:406-1275(-)
MAAGKNWLRLTNSRGTSRPRGPTAVSGIYRPREGARDLQLDLLSDLALGLLEELREEGGGEVPLAEGGDDGNDALPLVLGPVAQLDGGRHGSARRDPAENALLLREPAGHGHGVGARDLDDLIDDALVAVVGHEARADALDLVGAGGAAREDGGLGGLDGHGLELGVLLLEEARRARDGAPSAHTPEEEVDLPVSLLPDLWASRLIVDLDVVGVVELLEHVGLVAHRGHNVLSLLDGALHREGRGGEHELGAERLEHHAALEGHGLRHGEDQVVALGGRHHGEGDASVA